jgi:hypothetical protein
MIPKPHFANVRRLCKRIFEIDIEVNVGLNAFRDVMIDILKAIERRKRADEFKMSALQRSRVVTESDTKLSFDGSDRGDKFVFGHFAA